MNAKMKVLCHETIWLTKSTSTYCMREKGHPDDAKGHSILPDEVVSREKVEEVLGPSCVPPVPCTDAMCWFATQGIEHMHTDPTDLTKARVKVNTEMWQGAWGTNG